MCVICMSDKMLSLEKYLKSRGIITRMSHDRKLYLLNPIDNFEEISLKCNELAINYVVHQEPALYDGQGRILSFCFTAWFEELKESDKND